MQDPNEIVQKKYWGILFLFNRSDFMSRIPPLRERLADVAV